MANLASDVPPEAWCLDSQSAGSRKIPERVQWVWLICFGKRRQWFRSTRLLPQRISFARLRRRHLAKSTEDEIKPKWDLDILLSLLILSLSPWRSLLFAPAVCLPRESKSAFQDTFPSHLVFPSALSFLLSKVQPTHLCSRLSPVHPARIDGTDAGFYFSTVLLQSRLYIGLQRLATGCLRKRNQGSVWTRDPLSHIGSGRTRAQVRATA